MSAATFGSAYPGLPPERTGCGHDNFDAMDPKRHRERRPWTIISAIVWLPKSWRRQGWGFAEKRKNESGFEHELPPDEVLERAERLAKLLTLSYEPMLAWRLDGPIEFWNTGAERLYGFTQDQAVGGTSHALLGVFWAVINQPPPGSVKKVL